MGWLMSGILFISGFIYLTNTPGCKAFNEEQARERAYHFSTHPVSHAGGVTLYSTYVDGQQVFYSVKGTFWDTQHCRLVGKITQCTTVHHNIPAEAN